MKFYHNNFSVEIFDDTLYRMGHVKDRLKYGIEYFDGDINEYSNIASTQHGIRVYHLDSEIASAIIGDINESTSVHANSHCSIGSTLLLCCSNKLYAFVLPILSLKWCVGFKGGACLGVYTFEGKILVHQSKMIRLLDTNGESIWDFSGKEVFERRDGKKAIIVENEFIKVYDWTHTEFILNIQGRVTQSEQINSI